MTNDLAVNFKKLDRAGEKRLEDVFAGLGMDESEIEIHLHGRLDDYRGRMIPWLNSLKPLHGARILEIGCGTGASTLAFCEQGASVLAIDVEESSIAATATRCELYGVRPELLVMNGGDVQGAVAETFDFVVFSASLEHMLYSERLHAIRAAFAMVAKDRNGLVVLIEVPNRLWCTDMHTSNEPFFSWLPDDIAMDYSRFTTRKGFCDCFRGGDIAAERQALYRWGRGVSYHEFEIALGRRDAVEVTSGMYKFMNYPDYDFKKNLALAGPGYVHDAFYESWLYLAMKEREA